MQENRDGKNRNGNRGFLRDGKGSGPSDWKQSKKGPGGLGGGPAKGKPDGAKAAGIRPGPHFPLGFGAGEVLAYFEKGPGKIQAGNQNFGQFGGVWETRQGRKRRA